LTGPGIGNHACPPLYASFWRSSRHQLEARGKGPSAPRAREICKLHHPLSSGSHPGKKPLKLTNQILAASSSEQNTTSAQRGFSRFREWNRLQQEPLGTSMVRRSTMDGSDKMPIQSHFRPARPMLNTRQRQALSACSVFLVFMARCIGCWVTRNGG